MTKVKIIGTYQIINTLDQKSYVGSSNDITRRWREHKTRLNNGTHHNVPLQRAWNKYKSEVFQFHIIEIADTAEESLQDEQQLLNALFDGGKTCYNTTRDTTAPLRGRIPYNKGKKASPEACAAISAAMTGKVPWNKGKKFPIESCKRMSAAHKGKVPWNKGKSKLSRVLEEQP